VNGEQLVQLRNFTITQFYNLLNFNDIKNKWIAFWKSPKGKLTGKWLRRAFMVSIIGFLVWQILQIGWQEVLKSLPTTPWFYLIFLILYFALPMSEQFIYRMSLNFGFWEGLKVFIQKKVLNLDVMGYTGEAYFYVWGKQHLKEDDKHIFNVIKDNNIISSFASTLLAIILLTIFISVSEVDFLEVIKVSQNVVIGVVIVAIIVIFLGIYFRKYIISMNRNMALKVFGIHVFRIIFVYTLEVLQWMVVLPLVPLHIWFVFLSARIISSRLPFIPSQDLLFVSISLEMSKYMDVSGAGIAGIMIANNFLNKSMNLILYSFFSTEKK